MPAPSRVLLLTRAGCHLCEEAETAISGVCGELGVGWRAVDVDSDPALRGQWSDHVPVTFVDRNLHARWFLDPEALRGALRYGQAHPMPAGWLPAAP